MTELVFCKECGGSNVYPWNFGDEFEILGYTCADCDKDVECFYPKCGEMWDVNA